VKNGFSMSGMISPITAEPCPRSRRAVRFGVKSSSAAAARTSFSDSGETFAPFRTRLTVEAETPARAATS
jgi:hypothetical protein